MLRDYIWSLAIVALLLLAYTALVFINKKPADVTRSAASVNPPAATSRFVPVSEEEANR